MVKKNPDAFLLLNKILTEDKDIIALVALNGSLTNENDGDRVNGYQDFIKHLPKGEK